MRRGGEIVNMDDESSDLFYLIHVRLQHVLTFDHQEPVTLCCPPSARQVPLLNTSSSFPPKSTQGSLPHHALPSPSELQDDPPAVVQSARRSHVPVLSGLVPRIE